MSENQKITVVYTVLNNGSICINLQDYKVTKEILEKYQKLMKCDKINEKGRRSGWVYEPKLDKNLNKRTLEGREIVEQELEERKKLVKKKIKQLEKRLLKHLEKNPDIFIKKKRKTKSDKTKQTKKKSKKNNNIQSIDEITQQLNVKDVSENNKKTQSKKIKLDTHIIIQTQDIPIVKEVPKSNKVEINNKMSDLTNTLHQIKEIQESITEAKSNISDENEMDEIDKLVDKDVYEKLEREERRKKRRLKRLQKTHLFLQQKSSFYLQMSNSKIPKISTAPTELPSNIDNLF